MRLGLSLVLLGCACGSSTSTDAGTLVGCESDPRVLAWSDGLSLTSSQSQFHAKLVTASPAPPARGTNQWVLELTTPSGAPLEGATVQVVPFMPDHGHGTSVKAQVQELGAGRYQVETLYLFMPGVWRVSVQVSTTTVSDAALFYFCVEG